MKMMMMVLKMRRFEVKIGRVEVKKKEEEYHASEGN
ncbi:hypothetical protein A2U01_0082928 [Trifolium medium]|uniref:Uncharacterized protein n=1 Tax=Trifolium medium TaxID=97028 RepID=A0A392TKJ7_9FABA|nr:hypothetical protein [Trifolium medium]